MSICNVLYAYLGDIYWLEEESWDEVRQVQFLFWLHENSLKK